MEIVKNISESNAEIKVIGRLDTTTAPELESVVKPLLADLDKISLDFSDLEYISSSGLRVVLSVHKEMMKKGGLVVKNVSEDIKEIFDVTGFMEILNIE